MAAPTLSLKGRALRYLAAREHSRLELERKLARHAGDEPGAAERIAQVLDQLRDAGLLCEQRFVEAMVRQKSARWGTARIAQALHQHRLDDTMVQASLQRLQGSESERALAVWQRRFGSIPAEPKERAKQMRFLQSRGFSSEVIYRIFRHAENSET